MNFISFQVFKNDDSNLDLINNSQKVKPSIVKVITIIRTNADGTRQVSYGSGFIVMKMGNVNQNFLGI